MNSVSGLRWTERVAYGVGGFSVKLIFYIIGTFLTVYMTNVAMLDIAVISTIIAVSKVFDGISDLIVGNIIDNTSSRFGKARVWILRMCLPFALSALLLFRVPETWPSMVKYIYVFLAYNAVTTVFMTFMQVSQYSLLSLITQDSDEQGLLSSVMNFFIFASHFIVSTFFVRLLTFFSDKAGEQNTQRGYTFALMIFCLMMVAASLITVFGTREREGKEERDRRTTAGIFRAAGVSLKALTSHRYWLIMIFVSCIQNIMLQVNVMGCTYFAMYILHDMGNISWMIGLMIVPVMAVQFINPWLMRRFGKKRVAVAGALVLMTASIGLMIVTPYVPAMKAVMVLKGCGMGMLTGTNYGLMAEVISYTNRETGVHAAGFANAGFTATEKFGQGVGSVLYGFAMSIAGFSGALATQPEAVLATITALFLWTPLIVSALNALIMGAFFRRNLNESI